MQTVIFAAGRGTRFGELTRNLPKPLLQLNDRPIIDYTLEALPSIIDEVIIVVGYLGGHIKNYLGDRSRGVDIKYLEQPELNGTAGALWLARHYLHENFLVINGDDFYEKRELENLISERRALGINRRTLPGGGFWNILVDDSGHVLGLNKPLGPETVCNIATGAYVLDQGVFQFEPAKLANGELGLPQTIFRELEHYPIRAVSMDSWFPINSMEDLKNAELALRK